MDTLTKNSPFITSIKNIFAGLNPAGDDHRQAMDLFLANGLPTAKSEEYRFTSIARLLDTLVFSESVETRPVPKEISLQRISDMPCNLVAFVNGVYSVDHTVLLDSSIKISRTEGGAVDANQDVFALLNRSFCREEIHIQVSENQAVKHPLAVVYYVDDSSFVFANPRWTCELGAKSRLTIIEYTVAAESAKWFTNKHSRIDVGETAELEFITFQSETKEEIQVNNSLVNLSSSSKAVCYTFTSQGKLIRNNLTLTLNGENIDASLNGLYLPSGNSLIDNHTVVDHRKPGSHSNELYKGILDGHGKGVFNGKIFVRADAQKTNAFQSNRNILLDETATIHTKPQLEIWADDVKCSHGCTTGQLDEEALFYLRSRGLSKDTAKGMLLYAFAAETLNALKHEAIRSFIDKQISDSIHP